MQLNHSGYAAYSGSTTITETAPTQKILRLRTHMQNETPEEFLQKQLSSPLFSIEDKELMELLISTYNEEPSMSMAMVINDIIQPRMLNAELDEESLNHLADTENEAKKILIFLLPEKMNIDDYLDEIAFMGDEFDELQNNNSMEKLEEKLAEKTNEIYQIADQVLQQIEKAFESQEEQLELFLERNGEKLLKLERSQELNNKKMADQDEKLKTTKTLCNDTGKKIEEVQKNYLPLLEKSYELLGRIKK